MSNKNKNKNNNLQQFSLCKHEERKGLLVCAGDPEPQNNPVYRSPAASISAPNEFHTCLLHCLDRPIVLFLTKNTKLEIRRFHFMVV